MHFLALGLGPAYPMLPWHALLPWALWHYCGSCARRAEARLPLLFAQLAQQLLCTAGAHLITCLHSCLQVKPSLGEMEQQFLEALSAWYYDGKPTMEDEEFAVLKEELTWMGSKVVVLDSAEQRFLEASMAYQKGKPILSDQEFDALKTELRTKGSFVTAQGPRCSIRSKKMYADAEPDVVRMLGLNLPSALLVLGAFAGVDYATGFGITNLIELPAPYGVWALWVLVLPTLFVISYALTQIGFKDSKVLKAPCPSCGTENFTYFGDVFTVSGNRGQNVVECVNCKADLTFDEYKCAVVVSETSEVKQVKIAEMEAKKAAAAAKKKVGIAARARGTACSWRAGGHPHAAWPRAPWWGQAVGD